MLISTLVGRGDARAAVVSFLEDADGSHLVSPVVPVLSPALEDLGLGGGQDFEGNGFGEVSGGINCQ
jgi:hypothetical protein